MNTNGRGRLRADLSTLGVIAAVLTLAHLLTLERYGVFRDELYYIACSRHLDWGYVDHPPMVAAIAAIFGPSWVALRLVSAVAFAAMRQGGVLAE